MTVKGNRKKDLLRLFKTLDKEVPFKATIICLGGTVLTLADIKEVSHDIDLIVPLNDKKKFAQFCEIYDRIAKKLRLAAWEHPPFPAFDMSLLTINDYITRSKQYKGISLKRIDVLLMDIYDVVLSKLNRSLPRDIDDISLLIEEGLLSRTLLKQRYFELMRQQEDMEIRKHFVGKVETFLEKFGEKLKS